MKKILLVLCFLCISLPIYLIAFPLAIIGFIVKTSVVQAIEAAANFIDWMVD